MLNRPQIIARIQKDLSDRFRVFDNTGTDKKIVGGEFPDVVILQKEPPPNNNILFVMKLDDGENFVNSLSEWKGLASTTSTLYIVLPQNRLDDAKKLAAQAGLGKAKFAWVEEVGGETVVHYE